MVEPYRVAENDKKVVNSISLCNVPTSIESVVIVEAVVKETRAVFTVTDDNVTVDTIMFVNVVVLTSIELPLKFEVCIILPYIVEPTREEILDPTISTFIELVVN
jgi:hypothetical protein